MNTPTLSDLALVYDEKCAVLEKARVAYSVAVNATLSAVATALARRSDLDEEIRGAVGNHSYFEPNDDPSALLRKTLQYNIPGPHGEPHLSVLVRFSSPWEQSPGLLQFGLVSQDSKWTEYLRKLTHADEWVVKRTPLECSEIDWLYAETIRLSGLDLVTSASQLLEELLRLAYRLVARLRKDSSKYRMEWLLPECKHRLEQDDQIQRDFPGRKIYEQTGDWEPASRYVQLNIDTPRYYGFWVACDVDQGSLIFAGNGGTVELQSTLQLGLHERVGAQRDWKMYRPGELGGTIRDASQLRNASDEEILKVMLDTFKTYLSVVRDSLCRSGKDLPPSSLEVSA